MQKGCPRARYGEGASAVLAILTMLAREKRAARGSGWLRAAAFGPLPLRSARVPAKRHGRDEGRAVADRTKEGRLDNRMILAKKCRSGVESVMAIEPQ
jgi:hypothetical protein